MSCRPGIIVLPCHLDSIQEVHGDQIANCEVRHSFEGESKFRVETGQLSPLKELAQLSPLKEGLVLAQDTCSVLGELVGERQRNRVDCRRRVA